MSNKKQLQKKKEQLNSYARFSGAGFQMLAIITIGVWGGLKLDEIYPNNYQIFTIICSLTSIGVALYHIIKQVKKISKQKNNLND